LPEHETDDQTINKGRSMKDTTTDTALRQHVLSLLEGKNAHQDFESFVADLPPALVNRRIDSVPYTMWHVLEHIRLAQGDILEFSRNAAHQSPDFPEGYWPAPDATADASTLTNTINAIRSDLNAMRALVQDSQTDLFAAIPHGTGQTILREALLLADHNSYHLGALLVMRRILEGRAA
jgi:hypothetical protein